MKNKSRSLSGGGGKQMKGKGWDGPCEEYSVVLFQKDRESFSEYIYKTLALDFNGNFLLDSLKKEGFCKEHLEIFFLNLNF